jgi:hypothetical protein
VQVGDGEQNTETSTLPEIVGEKVPEVRYGKDEKVITWGTKRVRPEGMLTCCKNPPTPSSIVANPPNADPAMSLGFPSLPGNSVRVSVNVVRSPSWTTGVAVKVV